MNKFISARAVLSRAPPLGAADLQGRERETVSVRNKRILL